MIKTIAAGLLSIVAGSLAVHAMPPALVAANVPVPVAFDMAMPAEQELLGTSVISAVDPASRIASRPAQINQR